jgi:hypothetical protein
MSTAKKHHFVPQFVLRRFAIAGTQQLHVFDKQTGRAFKANIADVAAENRLYDFSIGEWIATIEPSLADFESKAAAVLQGILAADSLTSLALYDRVVLAVLIAQLLLRSPHQRAVTRDMTSQLRSHVERMGTDPDTVPQLKVFDDNEEKQFTVRILDNLAREFAPIIATKCWVLHSAPDNLGLYVSDNPVAMHNELDAGPRGNLGLGVLGVEVYCPLTSGRCLGMYCPTVRDELDHAYDGYLARTRSRDGREQPLPEVAAQMFESFRTGQISPLTEESVEFMNSLQVWNAERFVFSSSGDFDLARKIVERNPALRTGPRPRTG